MAKVHKYGSGYLKRCRFHLTGVPGYALGKPFYCKGCVECEKKLAKGLVTETDPTPTDYKNRMFGRGDKVARRIAQIRAAKAAQS